LRKKNIFLAQKRKQINEDKLRIFFCQSLAVIIKNNFVILCHMILSIFLEMTWLVSFLHNDMHKDLETRSISRIPLNFWHGLAKTLAAAHLHGPNA
jgi:hypothetical protein